MRYSQLLIPTVKETPAEAEIPSHRLMIRAGLIRKVASGTYTYLPLGWRSLLKIMNIVRQEMDVAGAQEISMPILQPMELWQQTGRDVVFQDIMCKFTDRHGRENVLAPTAEEVVTALTAAEIKSYKQLPVNLYQINTKFRDEFRPRFGVLRSREFIMKDAYSFDACVEGLDESYRKMFDAYCRIFQRCGLEYVTVEADSGGMGGTDTEEFMIPCAAGEDVLLSSDKGNYAANVEKAETGPRPHDLSGEPTGELDAVETPQCRTIEEVSAFFKKNLKTKLKSANLLKTLVLKAHFQEEKPENFDWIIAVVRGDHELNEMKLLSRCRDRFENLASIEMADPAQASQAGLPIGFVGPHAVVQTCKSILVVDPDAAQGGFWVSGANETDKHVRHFNWKREVLEPLGEAADFRLFVEDIRNALQGDPSPREDGGVLRESQGIEVGHVFKLGTKYSKILGATFLDEDGAEQPCIMGCYGIGINRILAAAIELYHDENGCVLPVNIAPFEVLVVQVNNDSEEVRRRSRELYDGLKEKGVDVLLDDRDARPGVKFKDADLLGIPLRVVVGDRGLKEGNVEIKKRTDDKPSLVNVDQALDKTLEILSQLKAEAGNR
jgi:prolyl-tRNA synthetase